jgi:uncharacterized membrane protein YgcG
MIVPDSGDKRKLMYMDRLVTLLSACPHAVAVAVVLGMVGLICWADRRPASRDPGEGLSLWQSHETGGGSGGGSSGSGSGGGGD